jgi:alkylation response protein AidB-like acyl-CoA dehydrogenase
MSFAFTEDQQLLAESADRFVRDEYGFEARKKILASDDGFSREHWGKFAELGWLALPLPEEHGGIGGSAVDLAVLLECMGRGLVVEPYYATVVLGAAAVQQAGSAAQQSAILPGVAEGTTMLAFGHSEPKSRFDLAHVETAAKQDGGGWRLSGHKAVVLHAASADHIVVSARTSGAITDRDGITLFLVDPKAKGVSLRGYPTVDGLRAAEVMLSDVAVGADAVLGPVGGGADAIDAVADRALVGLSAEACGAMDAVVRQTTEYLKTREQFGAKIGSFQALQHRVVEMLAAKEFARALTYRAAGLVDTASPSERARAAAAAKAETGRAGKRIGQEAVQMHGGMGMTVDMAVGSYFKRLTMIDTAFGNAGHQLRRFAGMSA